MEVADRDFTQGLQLLLRAHTLAGQAHQRQDPIIARAARKLTQRATDLMIGESGTAHTMGSPLPLFSRPT